MKVTEFKIQTLSLRLPRPTGLTVGAGRPLDEVNPVLVRLRTDDGLEGIGYAMVTNRLNLATLRAAVADVAGLVVGEDPRRNQYLWHKMWQATAHVGHQGAALYAMAAVDTALWDLAAQSYGVPLYRLLGGFQHQIPVYASGWLWRSWSLDELQRDAVDLVAKGFRAIKMRVGGATPREEVERVRVVREAIGPDIDLMVDVNWGWDVSTAITVGRRLQEFDIYWLEDPLASDVAEQLALVSAALDVPVCAGETHSNKFGFRRLFETKAVDIAMIDLQRVGGITEWMRVAAMAQAWHLPVVSHLFWEIDVHLLAAVPNALMGEYMPWWGEMFQEAPHVVDGVVQLPQRPGLGLLLAEEAIKRLEIK
jgi:L-alanine-DL-glutamate epimerase-like enolase superfamily enzyme